MHQLRRSLSRPIITIHVPLNLISCTQECVIVAEKASGTLITQLGADDATLTNAWNAAQQIGSTKQKSLRSTHIH
jgi:hypothetical protein